MKNKKVLFDSLNSFFDQIYLITLKRSTDRHPLIKKILNGLNYQITWGVDGKQLDREELLERKDHSAEIINHPSLTPGEIGCTLSHANIYMDILEKDYQKVLILEDDIKVNTEAFNSLPDSLNDLPKNWEFLYLGYLEKEDGITMKSKFLINFIVPVLNRFRSDKIDPERLRRKYFRPYSKNLQLAGKHSGAHGYAITKKGAEKVLDYLNSPSAKVIDNAVGEMCMNGIIHAFRLKDEVFYQNRELTTTIENRYS